MVTYISPSGPGIGTMIIVGKIEISTSNLKHKLRGSVYIHESLIQVGIHGQNWIAENA